MGEAVFAPGKVILTGEYAVLVGAPAVVVAIDRGITATATDRPGLWRRIGETTEEVTVGEAFRVWSHRAGRLPAGVELDASELYHPETGEKLGLGSSGAEASALWRMAHGGQVSLDAVAELKDIAEGEAHYKGSGADLVAGCLGGVHQVTSLPALELTPLELPPLWLAMAHTGRPAYTRHQLEAFYAAHESQDPRFAPSLKHLVKEAKNAARKLPKEPLEALAAYREAVYLFFEAFDPDLLVPEYGALEAIAENAGGIAKSAGAGGGDCVLAAFLTPGERQSFVTKANAKGFYAFAISEAPEDLL